MELSLSNVVNVSVSEAGAGVGEFNTSNLGLFTEEVPGASFGTAGYSIYRSPAQVGIDFGTGSRTYQMAVNIFSQKPNILANGGYLVVILIANEVQRVAYSGTPVSGSYVLSGSAAILFSDTAAQIQAKLRAVAGFEKAVVTGSAATGFSVSFKGTYGDQPSLTISSNSMQTAGAVAVTPAVTDLTAAETVLQAVTRAASIVQFFGILSSRILTQQEQTDLASTVQSMNKIAFVVSRDPVDVEVGGRLDLLRSGGQSKTRGLFYIGTAEIDSILYSAAYAGRALSTVFSGSRTAQTMHLKDLANVQPDAGMSETLLAKCQAAGADVYVSLQGVSKTFTSGANKFFDSVYNLEWFVGALKVAIFNLLAQTSTKLAQTEDDMAQYRGSARKICQLAVKNGYLAPGTWTLPETFGVQEDFFANIEQIGYYIFTQAIADQSTADREARKAPLMQIAGKEAGAAHSAGIIVNLNK